MNQKIVFQTKQAKDLENYKGKTVVVHAVRPNFEGEGFQKFSYVGVIDPELKESISIALGYFVLNVKGVQLNCDFVVSEKATVNDCFVMSVQDAKTGKVLYENGTSLKFDGKEYNGTGKIECSENGEYLNKFNGKPAILLNTFEKDGEKCMRLKLTNKVTYVGRIPKNFKLQETNLESENEETL